MLLLMALGWAPTPYPIAPYSPIHRLRATRLEMCEEPALSVEELEDSWRAVRAGLIGNDDVVPHPGTLGADPAGWAHKIAKAERGCILVAKPNVYFREASVLHKSVLLLLEHDDEMGGSLAIALNRPTDNKLSDVLQQESLALAFGDRPLNLGGTSAESGNSNVFMLCAANGTDRASQRAFTGDDEATPLLPNLWLASAGGAAERVNSGASPADTFHFFAGAYVWDVGKLESEFESGAWHALAASTPTITSFLLDEELTPEEKYDAALGWAVQSEADILDEDDGDDEGSPLAAAFFGVTDTIDAVHAWLSLLDEVEASPPVAPAEESHTEMDDPISMLAAAAAAMSRGEVDQSKDDNIEYELEYDLIGPSLSGALGVAHSLLEQPSPLDTPILELDEVAEMDEAAISRVLGLPFLDVSEPDPDHAKEWEGRIAPYVEAIAEQCSAVVGSSTPARGRSLRSLLDAIRKGAGHGGQRERTASSAASPRFTLHAIRQVILSRAGGVVIPDERPALEVEHLSLEGRLRALAHRLGAESVPDAVKQTAREAREAARVAAEAAAKAADRARAAVMAAREAATSATKSTAASEAASAVAAAEESMAHAKLAGEAAASASTAAHQPVPTRRGRGEAGVEMSSLQLGLVITLVAQRLGLNASLVEVESSGLLLRVDMSTSEEPLYMSLEPGSGCGRTLEQRDCVMPHARAPPTDTPKRKKKLMIGLTNIEVDVDDDDEADAPAGEGFAGSEHELQPFEIAALLAEECTHQPPTPAPPRHLHRPTVHSHSHVLVHLPSLWVGAQGARLSGMSSMSRAPTFGTCRGTPSSGL